MSGYEIRRYDEADRPAVLELMGRSLGWRPGDPNAELFRWKHEQSSYGPSPAWIAVDETGVIGFRTFLRWEFERAGEVVRAVRAVDTATDPAHQGRGIFKALTLHGLEDLRVDGVSFVFNTPNAQSRPGYLKMGWQLVGRLPVSMRPRSPASLARTLRARTPAELWSTPTTAGDDASTVLADDGLAALLAQTEGRAALATYRTSAHLRLRYGLPELEYRAMLIGRAVEDGVVVFRLRRRGAALEAALCEVLAPPGRRVGRALGSVLRQSGADYLIGIGSAAGMVPLPRQGPLLTCRSIDGTPLPDWAAAELRLGDIELF